MEAKLREYRALRRRKELLEKTKEKIEHTKTKLADLFLPKIFKDMMEKKEEEKLLLEEEEIPEKKQLVTNLIQDEEDISEEESEAEIPEKEESWRYFCIKWTLYLTIWCTLFMFFVNIGFGAVYFIITLLIAVCLNTRTRKKRRGEVSAYSVFNKNCKSIQGTLDAEQIDKSLRNGSVAGAAFRLF